MKVMSKRGVLVSINLFVPSWAFVLSCCSTFESLTIIDRDSPRDQLVVTLFVLAVLALLLVAAIRNK
jgi:hypothetical protein